MSGYVASLAPPGDNITGVALKNVPAVRVKASARRYHPHQTADNTGYAPTKPHTGMPAQCEPHGNWRRSMPTKTREKKASAGKTNALQKPLQPSEELAAVVGSGPLPRGQVVSKMWEYISARIACRTRRTAAKSWPTTSSGGSSARTR